MIGQKVLDILEQLRIQKLQTPRQLAFTLKLNPNEINAMCQRLNKKGILERERSSSYGKLEPWRYKLTPKGLKFLSLKKQLKALFSHEQ